MQTRTNITIDAAQEMGKLSPVWRPGLLIWPGCQALEKFEKEIGYGYTYNFWITTCDVEPTGFSSTEYDDMMAKVDKAGGVAIINLYGIPRWLTSCPEEFLSGDGDCSWGSCPPKDYNKWKEIVYSVIKHFSVDCGFKNILYEPWDEPDEYDIGFWYGTPEEFLKLYQYATFAVKEIEERFGVKVRIGGPRTTTWHPPGYDWMYNFIKFCGENKLPLDFVSWHYFDSKDARRMIEWRIVPRTKEWLKEFGFDPETPLIIDEWSMYPGDDIAPAYRDDEKYASYIPATIYVMSKIGIHRQCIFDLQGGLGAKDRIIPEYRGERDWSVITPHGVIKPSYNSLRLLTKLGSMELAMSISDDAYIRGVATRDREKIAVLVCHYIPIEPVNKEQQIARKVDVTVRNLPSGHYHYERYLIDKDHSNSYAVKRKLLDILTAVRVRCLQETKERMMEQGCTEEDMELFEEIADEFSDSPKKAKERIDSLSETARQQVQKMMALYVRLYNDAAVDKASEINEWREVSLQKVEERDIELKESSAEYRAQLGLKPYSVCLITLTEHRSETK